jgi:hypothetical protein
MADGTQRGLERRAHQGDPAAAASLLRSRVRAGALHPDGLWLAAYLGHPPAQVALGSEAPEPPTLLEAWTGRLEEWRARGRKAASLWRAASKDHVRAWCGGLAALEREVLARVALAAARSHPALDQLLPPATAAQQALRAAEAWLAAPTPAHTAACMERSDACLAEAGHASTVDAALTRSCAYAASVAGSMLPASAADNAAAAIRMVGHTYPDQPAPSGWDCPAQTYRFHAETRRAIEAALLPWALARREPLRV